MSDDLWTVELGQGMGVIKLGATREEVLRRLNEAGVELEIEEDDDEPHWEYVDEMVTELHFTTDHPYRLREIVVEDERVRLGPLPVIGERLHQVVDLLQVPDAETHWRLNVESDEETQQRADDGSAGLVPDNDLLNHGTLWIPSLGLGLGMWRGEITSVRLRKPEDAPRAGISPLTAAQRELSAREDLYSYLSGPSQARVPRSGGCLPTVLTLAMIAALGFILWRAINYQLRWNASPTVEGEVIAVEPPPPEPFPDKYTIAYQDQTGQQHQVVWTSNKVYGIHKVGDKLELRYLPEAPERPVSPPDVSDEAFVKFLPWGIGVFAVYLVLQFGISLVGLVWGARRSLKTI